MKKVIVFTTDSTISLKSVPMLVGALPPLKGDDLLALLPRDEVEIIFEEVSNVPSSHMTPAAVLDLAQRVDSALLLPDINGVVVLHGTDTLEETAYMLDLTTNSLKPVVVTGAMRHTTSLGYDGLLNLASAIRVAAAPEARDLGVLVVLNDEIHGASAVQQLHSQGMGAFQSPDGGPLGRLTGKQVAIRQRPLRRQYIPCSRLEERVDLIHLTQGADVRLLRHSIEDGVAGVVLETFGSGRVPPWWLPTIAEAARRRTVIAVTTRCGAGGLGDEYGYLGAYHDLKRANLLFVPDLSGVKARIKLMVALGAARNVYELRGWFGGEAPSR